MTKGFRRYPTNKQISTLCENQESDVAKDLIRAFGGKPRPKERIQPIIDRVRAIWVNYPDYRYLQLMSSIDASLKHYYGKEDLFYLEDDLFQAGLELILKHGFNIPKDQIKRGIFGFLSFLFTFSYYYDTI